MELRFKKQEAAHARLLNELLNFPSDAESVIEPPDYVTFRQIDDEDLEEELKISVVRPLKSVIWNPPYFYTQASVWAAMVVVALIAKDSMSGLFRDLSSWNILNLLEARQVSGGLTNILFHVRVHPSVLSLVQAIEGKDQKNALTGKDVSGMANQSEAECLRDCAEDSSIRPAAEECMRAHGVSVRFSGRSKSEIVNRSSERQITNLLSELGLCKRIIWRLYDSHGHTSYQEETVDIQVDEWWPGSRPKSSEFEQGDLDFAVAALLGQLHSVDHSGLKNSSWKNGELGIDDVWTRVHKWFDIVSRERATFGLSTEKIASMWVSIQQLERENQLTGSPYVLSHNDLLPGNILVPPKWTNCPIKVHFIDYEYAGIDPRAFDIANYFCEMAGFDCKWFKLPNINRRMDFVTMYLKAVDMHTTEKSPMSVSSQATASSPQAARGGHKYDEELRERAQRILYEEVSSFMTTSHLHWGLWGLVQSRKATSTFDYRAYGLRRLARFEFEVAKPLRARTNISW